MENVARVVTETEADIPDWITPGMRKLVASRGWSVPKIEFRFSQKRIDTFAGLTGDRAKIHVDQKEAQRRGLPSTIAHGLFTLSTVPALVMEFLEIISDEQMTVILRGVEAGFENPVPCNSNLRVEMRVDFFRVKMNQAKIVLAYRGLLPNGIVALQGKMTILCFPFKKQ